MDTTSPRGWRAVVRHPWFKPLAVAVLSVAVGWLILRFVKRIDWSSVGDALGRLEWWQVGVLVILLLLRQAFNAAPIARFTPGLGLRKALATDLSANLVGTIAPPPGDVVIRLAMFRTWNINAVDGMTGVTLNMLVFYGARFIAPVLGLVALAFVGIETHHVVTALSCLAIAIAIIGGLTLIVRADRWAALLGRNAARVVSQMRAEVDPEEWADAVVDFRRRVAATLSRNLLPAIAAMLVGILVDGAILYASLRFVGLEVSSVNAAQIMSAFLLAYPLTILPLFGLGALDAVLISAFTEAAGAGSESAIVAGIIVWRTVTIVGTLLLGIITTASWRAQARRNAEPAPASGG